ncbi:hypothetical protein [Kitasatospora atroaurantiaca]|uniref:ARB-07466-like C-terminal domain-containing protein n=1 Tax=Kitasatospora atroaurantiaca TaxID=285545 RepID=A0A561EUN9_9ACTN|nr:hypothetical protein [Kitasatospora atroaurantiaca]TWE19332.1 hypothetical protein FB465_4448 [Kitasatospora atroaurantiaca]
MAEDGLGGSESTGRRRRRPLRLVLIGLVALSVIAGGVLYFNREKLTVPPEGCKITTAGGKGTLDLAQAANAATITAVALSRGLPERAVTIALATAMQESKIHNLTGGDRDSVGLFQQRPSQGWGTAQQISDPVYATNKFLDGLVKVPGYARMPLTDAAQQVQKSGYPQAYAKHETNATLLSAVLTGREPAALNCVVHELAAPAADPSAASTAPTASSSPVSADGQQPPDVSERVRREFGRTVSAAPAAKAAKDPRAVLALTPQLSASTDSGPGAQRQSGWAVAQWAVAQAQELGIGAVAYDGKVWRFDKPSDGWQPKADGTAADRVLVTLGAPAKH